jgi:hypothetical protein
MTTFFWSWSILTWTARVFTTGKRCFYLWIEVIYGQKPSVVYKSSKHCHSLYLTKIKEEFGDNNIYLFLLVYRSYNDPWKRWKALKLWTLEATRTCLYTQY